MIVDNNFCPFKEMHNDCFALLADNQCFSLINTEFKKPDCPFYKTSKDVDPRYVRQKMLVDKHIRNKKGHLL